MMKKLVIFVLSVIVVIGIVVMVGRYSAKKAISDYMDNQGIDKKDIVVDDFFKDWKVGGYLYCVSINDEDPDIYYEYHYESGKIRFSASKMDEESIKEKVWGGNVFSDSELQNLKYPPLKE